MTEQLKNQIEQEAKEYADLKCGDKAKFVVSEQLDEWNYANEDYIAGATAYATCAITAEQEADRLRKALRDFATRLNEHCTKQGIYSAGIHKIHDDILEAITPKPTTNE